RLELVGWYHDRPDLCGELRDMMKGQPDIDRALSRLSMGHGGPRDLQALSTALSTAADLVGIATRKQGLGDLAELSALHDMIMAPVPLSAELAPALADELPLLARDGGFVRAGFDASLDELRALRDESRRLIAALQQQYVEATGIASLKVKHNNVLGYHVDVRNTHAEKLM
ncbi:MAG: DNA mismatch repair protein MutS, partial [Pseudomonadota bacterium]|nr:DNA mismatch repair protein MutS [Pseudomonadota bacterium]